MRERLQRIQSHLGCDADGIIGPQTIGAIETAIGLAEPFRPQFPFREALAEAAEGEVGVTETGGNNVGKRVNDYKAATWLEPDKPWPWCAAFVCWCFNQALKENPIQNVKRPRTAGAWDFETSWAAGKYGPTGDVQTIRKPGLARRGDIVVYKFSHIGIVTRDYREGVIGTVEGNTNQAGSREGDGVFRKTRKASQVRSLIRINH